MKQELEPGMVFALEPKIVLPGIGPVGIENSWAVTTDGLEKLTLCKEEIIELCIERRLCYGYLRFSWC